MCKINDSDVTSGRRVRCDELRPTCANCMKRRVVCRYDRYPAVISVGVGIDHHRPKQLFSLPTQPGGLTDVQKHWLAAVKCALIFRGADKPSVIKSGGIPPLPVLNWQHDHTVMSRIRGMLAYALGRGQDYAPPVFISFGTNDLALLRRLYTYYTGLILSSLVDDIRKPEKYLETRLITRLGMMIYDDVVGSAPSLRNNLNGFMAAVSEVGGLLTAIEDGHIRPGIVQMILVTIVMTNTTSPSHDQMKAESLLSYSDIYSYYSFAILSQVPCPTVLFICILDINQLRGKIARQEFGRSGSTAVIKRAADAILKHVLDFQPETWTERYELPAPDARCRIACMFKYAVMLYGTMTLAVPAGMHFSDVCRLNAARYLLRIIQEALAKIGDFLGATWPLIVAGASLAGAEAEQAEVASLLTSLTRQPDVSDGLYFGIECLQRFWASGKTEWGDCFSSWQATVP
ncbi:hypothetical protein NLG97_g1732 [Lecanicillium saksenae]|uniref:Uncharacterized protein n=1 Tax=Lecanicillium saksenae TaxID=468837 RepID=A0ACC1R4U7_9HYPO|nr:hypothetical protein NLG97_g1732 [Lecanicillium saksenae]